MHKLFLPPDITPDEIRYCFGLISDTHMPERWPSLPLPIFDIFAGVDLILHAGDVGELWVLDQLAKIAPVTAVHGNDDTLDAQNQLPYQQIITVAGHRILLWHSHFPKRADEMEFRKEDGWESKLNRNQQRATNAGADVVIFGHTHIPMTVKQAGVCVVNPGAIASGNFFSRQLLQSVALLFITRKSDMCIVHVDLAQPHQIYRPQINWAGGFREASLQYEESIVAPELLSILPFAQQELAPADIIHLKRVVLRIAHRCWSGEIQQITAEIFLTDVATDAQISDGTKDKIGKLIERI